MDRIVSHSGPVAPLAKAPSHELAYPGSPAPWPAEAVGKPAAPVKSAGDYLKAARRRIGLILAIAALLAIPGSIYAVRKPDIFRVEAFLLITPPHTDSALRDLLVHGGGGGDGRSDNEQYIPNSVSYLKSKPLAFAVSEKVAHLVGPKVDPVKDLEQSLSARLIPNTGHVQLSLEGADKIYIREMLQTLVDEFERHAREEQENLIGASQYNALRVRDALVAEVNSLKEKAKKALEDAKMISPTGENLLQSKIETYRLLLADEQRNKKALVQESLIRKTASGKGKLPPSRYDAQLMQLDDLAEKFTGALAGMSKLIRNFDSDPQAKQLAARLAAVQKQRDRLRERAMEETEEPADFSEELIKQSDKSIANLTSDIANMEQQLRAEMPAQQNYIMLVKERDEKAKELSTMESRVRDFQALRENQKNRAPVKVLQSPREPNEPVRPNRLVYVAGFIFVGLIAGLGLVCMLEHFDHTVKAPEQLTAGVAKPLYGIIPRIPRTALTDRNGHLWTPNDPLSASADAFRNLRASLVGAGAGANGVGPGDRGSLTSLLITSAKSGEGKSTVALNLAASCARAGERTLLIDVDLRKPSLLQAFPDAASRGGLIDVLRGDAPWQRVVFRTDLANLDFIAVGDGRGVPTEILGTLELRQMLQSVSNHYDRVILDGPAVLGLADCRMLGRMVDASLLIVRAGSLTLQPILRAKQMLEQSRVELAGVVLNALYDDVKNWSNEPCVEDVYDRMLGRSEPRPLPGSIGPDADSDGAEMDIDDLDADEFDPTAEVETVEVEAGPRAYAHAHAHAHARG